jgi:hypothetical protein
MRTQLALCRWVVLIAQVADREVGIGQHKRQ